MEIKAQRMSARYTVDKDVYDTYAADFEDDPNKLYVNIGAHATTIVNTRKSCTKLGDILNGFNKDGIRCKVRQHAFESVHGISNVGIGQNFTPEVGLLWSWRVREPASGHWTLRS
jgi:hypothetical protein